MVPWCECGVFSAVIGKVVCFFRQLYYNCESHGCQAQMKSLSEPCGTNLSFCAKCLASTDTAHFPSFKLILYFKDRTASLFEADYYPFRHLTLLSMQLTAKKTHLTCLLLTLNMTALYNENAYTGLCVSQIIITECRPVL